MPITPRRDPEFPAWMTVHWTSVREDVRSAVVRRDFAAAFRKLGLVRAADVPPADLSARSRPFHPSGGRGPLARVPAGDLGEAVVRPYRRGGLAAELGVSRYFLGNRAFRELELTLRLRRAGVPTVEPLAAVQSFVRGPGYRAALVTRFVADAVPAPEALRAGTTRTVLRQMGRTARTLHEAGGLHPDLNAHNFLVPEDPDRPAVLLDFDRARQLPFAIPGPLARWGARRLRRSLTKLGLASALDRWDAFEEGYGSVLR